MYLEINEDIQWRARFSRCVFEPSLDVSDKELACLSEVPGNFIHKELTETQANFSYKCHIYK